MQKPPPWFEQSIEQIIGNLLRTGVIIAAIVVLAGGVLYLDRHGLGHPDYHTFQVQPDGLTTLSGIFHEAVSLRGRGIIQLGLLLLVLTPVPRVIVSAVAFMIERDWMYVAMTLFVLMVLLFSLLKVH